MGQQCTAQNPHESEATAILSESCGEDSVIALKRLALILKETNTKVYKNELNHPVLVDLGMIVSQCNKEGRHEKSKPASKAFGEVQVLSRAARYAKFADAAYNNGQEDILKGIQGEEDFFGNVEILHVHQPKNAKAPCPCFFIAFDKGTNEIVLSIRGARNMSEAITESVSEAVPFLEGTANGSLLAKATEVLKTAQEPLAKALETCSSLAIVGHSIGAGIAVLATIQAFGEGSPVKELADAGKVRCYAFGGPPTFEPTNKVPPKAAAAIFSFVNGMDCVPRTSPGSVGKLLQAVKKVDEAQTSIGDRVESMRPNSEMSAEPIPDFEEVPKEVKDDLKSLYGVGTILALRKDGGKRSCAKVTAVLFDKILMHQDMMSDHVMGSYEEALSEIAESLQNRKAGCC